MCHYLSFAVTEAGVGDIRLGTGWSHSGVAAAYGLRAGTYREGEWLDDGTLVVRTEADDDPVEWRERVLARYADRAALESAWQGAETRAVLNERGEVGTFVVRPPEVAMVGPRRVGGALYLGGCTGLTALPDGMSVGGGLDLSGCTGELIADAKVKGLRYYY